MWTDFELFVLEMLLFLIELIKSILHKKFFLMVIFRYIYVDIYEDLQIWKFVHLFAPYFSLQTR